MHEQEQLIPNRTPPFLLPSFLLHPSSLTFSAASSSACLFSSLESAGDDLREGRAVKEAQSHSNTSRALALPGTARKGGERGKEREDGGKEIALSASVMPNVLRLCTSPCLHSSCLHQPCFDPMSTPSAHPSPPPGIRMCISLRFCPHIVSSSHHPSVGESKESQSWEWRMQAWGRRDWGTEEAQMGMEMISSSGSASGFEMREAVQQCKEEAVPHAP